MPAADPPARPALPTGGAGQGPATAFSIEARALCDAMAGLDETDWDRPTRCDPWSVRELLGHLRVAVAWLPDMLAAPRPPRAEVSAVDYYRPDDRFAPQTNTTRIDLARVYAAGHVSGLALADDFAETWQRVARLCRAEPPDRVVRTRHGDPMLLSEFLVTRVVELAVHGLDLADALHREPWLTPQAADVVADLLFGPHRQAAARDLGWSRSDLLRKATGRAPLTAEETARVEHLGIRWLTLG